MQDDKAPAAAEPVTFEVEPQATIEVEIQPELKLEAPVVVDKPIVTAEPPKAVEPAPVEIDVSPQVEEPPVREEARPDPAVAELQAQLERFKERSKQDRAARAEAERKAQSHEAEIANNKQELAQTRLHAIVNAIHAEKSEAETLKQALRKAHTDGDADGVADITMKLGEIGSRMASLNDGKSQLETYLKNPRRPEAPKRQPQRPAAVEADADDEGSGDPVEDYIAAKTPRIQQFLRSRDRTWVADPKVNRKLVAAHHSALAEGYVEETPGYFAFIDEHMGVKVEQPKKAAPPRQAAKASVPAAPVSAKAATSPPSATSNMRVTLTPGQQQAAKDLGIPLAEYARRVWQMQQPHYEGPKFGGK